MGLGARLTPSCWQIPIHFDWTNTTNIWAAATFPLATCACLRMKSAGPRIQIEWTSNRLSSKGMQTIQADLSRSLLWSIIFPARLGLSEKRLPKKWWLIVILFFFHSNCHQLGYGIPNFRIAHTGLFHLVRTWATASVTTLRSVHGRLLGDELEFVIRDTLAHFKTSCWSVHQNQPFCSKIAGFYVHPSPRYGYFYGICRDP